MNIYFTLFVKFSIKSISTHAHPHTYTHASRRPKFLLITIIAFIRRIIAFFIIISIITVKNGERAQEGGAKIQTDRQKRRDSELEEEKSPLSRAFLSYKAIPRSL